MPQQNEKLYELWFRLAYKDLIKQKKMTTAIRPGVRKCPAPKCTHEDEIAMIQILLKPGDETAGLDPVFDDFTAKIKIKKIIIRELKDLQTEDLQNCSPDCQTQELAKYHLALIYNQEFTDNALVSVIHFEYL